MLANTMTKNRRCDVGYRYVGRSHSKQNVRLIPLQEVSKEVLGTRALLTAYLSRAQHIA
jgi:hypothetical protein